MCGKVTVTIKSKILKLLSLFGLPLLWNSIRQRHDQGLLHPPVLLQSSLSLDCTIHGSWWREITSCNLTVSWPGEWLNTASSAPHRRRCNRVSPCSALSWSNDREISRQSISKYTFHSATKHSTIGLVDENTFLEHYTTTTCNKPDRTNDSEPQMHL